MLGALALDYRGEQLRMSLDAYTDDETIDNGSSWMATFSSGKVISPPDTGSNLLRGIYGKLDNRAVVARAEYDFNANLTAYAALGSLRYRYAGFINGTRAAISNNAGDYRGMTYHQRGGTDTVSAEAGLRGSFRTGSVGHQVVLGLTSLDYDTYRANPGNSAAYNSNIYSPVTPLLGADPGRAPLSGDARLNGVALADTLAFASDRVLLTLGVRQQRVEATTFNITSGAVTAAYDERAITPAVGLVVKPWGQAASLYANYIEGLSQGDTVTDGVFSQTFAPYKTKQVETGIKWDHGSLTQTLALFRITRPSVIRYAQYVYDDNGEQRNQGVEWNVFGKLGRNVQVLGGVAYTDAELLRSATAAYKGNTAYGTPNWKINLGAEWDVPAIPGLSFSTRSIYTSAQYVNSANTLRIPDWVRYDIGARYVTRAADRDVTLRAYVENLLDKSYWAGSFSDGFVTQGGPRILRLSASVDL